MRWLLSLFCTLVSVAAMACEGLTVEHAWLRQPPPGGEVAAAYFDARNDTAREVIIQSVSSPDFSKAMLHETRMVDGHAEMRRRGDIVLAPGARFSAAPGGAHVMLVGARGALQKGVSLTLEVHCKQGAPLRMALPVRRDAPP